MREGERIMFRWSLDQLLALGYLEYNGPEEVRLTARGTRKADEIEARIPLQERILLLLNHLKATEGGTSE